MRSEVSALVFCSIALIAAPFVWCSDLPPAGAAAGNDTLYWGTYRSNLYFGARTRSPQSPLVGLMWFGAHNPLTVDQLRHSCEEGDGLDSYGWTRHDGTNYGEQTLIDSKTDLKLTTTFIKHQRGANGGEWVTRLSGQSASGAAASAKATESATSLFLYITVPDTYTLNIAGLSGTAKKKGLADDVQVEGQTDELGAFSFLIRNGQDNKSPASHSPPVGMKEVADLKKTHFYGYHVATEDVWDVKQAVHPILLQGRQNLFSQYRRLQEKDGLQERPSPFLFVPTLPNTVSKNSNVIVIQRVLTLPFEIDLVFVSHSAHPQAAIKSKSKKGAAAAAHRTFTETQLSSWALGGSEVNTAVAHRRREFESQFEEAFGLAAKGFTAQQRHFAMSTMSNLIGGISYFYGSSIVEDRDSNPAQPRKYYSPPKSLYTAVPSRPFFPRGFLWDEGFHQLLVRQWSPLITRDVLRHWFALQDPNTGWIAREQILGKEARSKVPPEFQAQNPSYANPPTLLFPLSASIQAIKKAQASDSVAGVVVNQDVNSLSSFGTAEQTTDVSAEFAFLRESYPQLAKWYNWFMSTQRSSGNGDAFLWVGRSVNHTFTSGLDDYPRAPAVSAHEQHVDLLSWMMFYSRTMVDISLLLGQDPSPYSEAYERFQAQLQNYWSEEHQCYCDIDGRNPATGLFNLVCHKGYVSLFPLFLGLVPTDSPNLGALLDLMRDENHLWSGYGLRSLSKADRYFGQGENYWKGPIWINMNYLALSALKNYYASRPGPHQARAQTIYQELRSQLVANMYNEYMRTGYVWEQYNPITGKGQRSHPFTGWSALVVLIMAEHYPEKYPLLSSSAPFATNS